MPMIQGTTGNIIGGKILVNGTNLAELSEKEMQKRRGNEIAMVFQEPMTSLNPVITIGVQMARAMRLHQKLEKQKVREKSIQLLEKVGIKHAEKTLHAYPHEVSGGMRQRIMIAMAMINKPSLLICDEPTSALDVIVQDQIIKLIRSLCVQEEMAVLFITHDMSVVAQIADQIAVMYLGNIVEVIPGADVMEKSVHPYTQALLKAIPIADPKRALSLEQFGMKGELPSPLHVPSGCRFHTRCPYAMDLCRQQEPELEERTPGHLVACWKK